MTTILTNAGASIPYLGLEENRENYPGSPEPVYRVACHPSVVDFLEQHGMASWGGYRYWMVVTNDGATPDGYYPEYANENPYLFASNSKDSGWTYICQVDNSGGPDGHGSADPAMLYDPGLDKIVIYYLKDDYGIYRRTFTSGHSLSAETLILAVATFGGLSPAIVRSSATGEYQMKYIKPNTGSTTPSDYQIYHRSLGMDGMTVGSEQACTASIIQNSYSGYFPWHIEMRENLFVAGRIEIVVSCKTTAAPGSYDGMVLVHTQSTLDNPTTITAPLAPAHLLDPAGGTNWNNDGLYRSSFVLRLSGSNLIIDLWYDGFSTYDAYDYVGFTTGVLYGGLPLYFSMAEMSLDIVMEGPTLYPSIIDGIKRVDGSLGGVIKKIDGSPGGVIKKFAGGVWQ